LRLLKNERSCYFASRWRQRPWISTPNSSSTLPSATSSRIRSTCSSMSLAPVAGAETALRIDLWVQDLDDYTCTYGFLCSSQDGRVPHARGERSVVNLDPATRRPTAWSRSFRSAHAELMKDLPAYA